MPLPRGYWIALILLVCLSAYGTLYPFDFRAGPEATERLLRLVREPSLRTSLGDLLANVALFIPLGVLAALIARPSRPAVVFGVSVLAVAFATGLQALQAFIPSRSSAAADVVWNTVGFGIGLAGGWLGHRWIASRRPPLDRWDFAVLLVTLLWIGGEMLPLVPSLDWASLRAAAKPLIHAPHADLAALAAVAAQVLLICWLVEDRLGSSRAATLVPVLLALVLGLRLISVGQTTTAAVPGAYVLGYFLWRASSLLPPRARVASVLSFALAAYTVSQLAPFEMRASPEAFSWVPFAAMLKGSMLANANAASNAVLVAGAFLLVACRVGAGLGPTAFALATWVAILEGIQIWIVGRTGDVTPILLTIGAAALIRWVVPNAPATFPEARSPTRDVTSRASSRLHPISPRSSRRFRAFAATATVVLVIAAGISTILRLPGMPYNVLELFRWNASLPAVSIFALALLWVGAAASWGGTAIAGSDRPARRLAGLTVLVALVSLALLYLSVTEESIEDITGSNNLYWFVTNKDIWGKPARHLFLAIGSPAVIAFFERPVRYIALYGPAFIFPAVMLACGERLSLDRRPAGWYASTLAAALLLLWLCKAIAFDWSSTDNLNELIARDGPWGLGGGGYLYALLGLIVGTGLVLSARLSSRAEPVGRLALVLLAIPAGWWLLSEGLGGRIEKYENVFSGAQFLLGPDRKHLLDDATLFGRWVIVQSGAVVIIAIGIGLGKLWRSAGAPRD